MSTRSVIARPAGSGFAGRYCHWDGYPSGVGKTLFHLWNEHFHGDTAAMMHLLIDEHPAGWSFIDGADFSLAPGFVENESALPDDHPDRRRPQCYCHGDRHDEPLLLTYPGGALCDAQYVYVIDEQASTMRISEVVGPYRRPRVRELVTVHLGGPEPDWEQFD